MKSQLVFALAFAALFAVTFGAGCTQDGHSFKVGETYAPLGQCIKYTCTGDNSLSALGCASAVASPKCKLIPEDKSKPYPQCCPSFKC